MTQQDAKACHQSVSSEDNATLPASTLGLEGFASRGTGTLELERQQVINQLSLRSIIGTDNRVRIPNTHEPPWSAICRLEIKGANQSEYKGTGWLVGPKTVVTAGHLVFNHDKGGWAREIKVIPGASGQDAPFGEKVAKRFMTVSGWVAKRADENDYGAILLDEGFDRPTFMAFTIATDEQLRRWTVNIAGYPADLERVMAWDANGIASLTANLLFHQVDTTPGQSGSPIWFKGEENRLVVGIHTTGNEESQNQNSGVRIIQEVFENIQRWKQMSEQS